MAWQYLKDWRLEAHLTLLSFFTCPLLRTECVSQVYDLPDDDNQSTNSSSNHGSICKEDEDEEEIEVPHPSPPPPTPAISPAHPRQPRQTRRGPASRVNRDRAAQAASEGEHHKYFVTPSSLQEPSLCSTVLEQAALERCMKEVGRKYNL